MNLYIKFPEFFSSKNIREFHFTLFCATNQTFVSVHKEKNALTFKCACDSLRRKSRVPLKS